MSAPKFIFQFTAAEIVQIEAYVRDRKEGHDAGWYYGNKFDFEMRENRILNELMNRDQATR